MNLLVFPYIKSCRLGCILYLCITLLTGQLFAQEGEKGKTKTSLPRKAFSEGLKLISTDPRDTIVNEASEDQYLSYSGKIIRRIAIDHIGFERSIYDSAKKVKRLVTDVANALHDDTRAGVIRNHLFFKPYDRLNPHRLADNERYLRDRDFLLDARILVTPVEGTDSVDVSVITRDVFSLGATVGGSFPTAPKIGIYDANVGGRGQRVQFTTLIDQDRSPKFGYSLFYRKSSIFGSLADIEVGYTQLNTDLSVGDENEFAVFARISRPLVSPYSRMAGGLLVSRNWSENVYDEPDTAFLSYQYKIFDSWLGYNIGIRKSLEDRNRHFVAFRFFDGVYVDQPDQLSYREEIRYNNVNGYLGEYTFYRQNFFKTRYVFGFGRTEDVPYGISTGIVAGYIRQLFIERPYGGVKFRYSQASREGNFYILSLNVGGYNRNRDWEDVLVNTGASYYTKLYSFLGGRFRSVASGTYSRLVNQNIVNWLGLRNEIPGFTTDSLEADNVFAFHLETTLYARSSLLGFRFAPFGAVDIVPVRCVSCEGPDRTFVGISAGIRTRNENLIFGTIEVKITYVPEDEYGDPSFNFSFTQNLRVKNTGTFAGPPTLVRQRR